jgi:hypothetical protein
VIFFDSKKLYCTRKTSSNSSDILSRKAPFLKLAFSGMFRAFVFFLSCKDKMAQSVMGREAQRGLADDFQQDSRLGRWRRRTARR